MKKKELLKLYAHFDRVHQVTSRAVSEFADAELDIQPVPDTLSTKALLHHLYSIEKILVESVRAGGFAPSIGVAENAELNSLISVSDVVNYGRKCHQFAHQVLCEAGNGRLAEVIKLPPFFGSDFAPGWEFFAFAYQEHWHHRGQLSTYMRLLGKPVLDIHAYDSR